jgi:alkylated DNA repair dioxygenase AlkB
MDMVQHSLFDLEEFDPGPGHRGPVHEGKPLGTRSLAAALERTELGDGAWIDVRRQWMAGSAALFERLLTSVPWRSERRRMYDRTVDVPRLLAFYDLGAVLPDPVLAQAKDALNAHYRDAVGAPLATTGVCLYRNGADSVAWHGDTIGRRSTRDTLVAIVSLGQERRFLLRSAADHSSLSLTVGHGDLLVLGGTCQRTWQHSVPKTARPVGPRISVQFRSAGVR